MMKLKNSALAALAIGALLLLAAACQKTEGPAEHAGKEIDKGVAKAGQQIEKAGEKIQDAAKSDDKK